MEGSSAWAFAGAWMLTGRCRSGVVLQTQYERGGREREVFMGLARRASGL